MPYFSIVIPVFNKERFVASTLKSVLSQNFSDFEIIVINDGSTDQSEAKILESNDTRIKYHSKKNEGVAIARNLGIQQSTADYICFLDADDFWHPNFLDTMHEYSQNLPNEKVFACAIEIETGKNTLPACYSFDKKADFEIVNFFEASRKEAVLWTSSACIHKTVFDMAGVFDEHIKISEDTDLWIRIGMHYPVVFIWKVLARYVFDEKSISRSMDYIFEDAFFEKYASAEKRNPKLKQYMDQNRFSSVIKYKLKGDLEAAAKLYSQIDLKKLSKKKRILIGLPPIVLKMLIRLQRFLANSGLGNSVFR